MYLCSSKEWIQHGDWNAFKAGVAVGFHLTSFPNSLDTNINITLNSYTHSSTWSDFIIRQTTFSKIHKRWRKTTATLNALHIPKCIVIKFFVCFFLFNFIYLVKIICICWEVDTPFKSGNIFRLENKTIDSHKYSSWSATPR